MIPNRFPEGAQIEILKTENKNIVFVFSSINGAGKRSRTSDLLITNQLLYQLSYSGKSEGTLD